MGVVWAQHFAHGAAVGTLVEQVRRHELSRDCLGESETGETQTPGAGTSQGPGRGRLGPGEGKAAEKLRCAGFVRAKLVSGAQRGRRELSGSWQGVLADIFLPSNFEMPFDT